ncbi:hypothetical protein HW555_009470, partial [Spodoptera exigua]
DRIARRKVIGLGSAPKSSIALDFSRTNQLENPQSLPDPLVCCPDCDFDPDDIYIHTSDKPEKPNNNDCAQPVVEKVPCKTLMNDYRNMDENLQCEKILDLRQAPIIAGGIAASKRQFPHMALLGYGKNPETAEWMCGGSIITKKFILTAAHCISSPSLGVVKYAALGILRRSDRKKWHVYDIANIIKHPKYRAPIKYHDIALLETGRDIVFNGEVLPACLLKDPRLETEVATATGWGKTGHRKPVLVVKLSDDKCRKEYPVHRHLFKGYDPATQLCYGGVDQGITDTCEGDSGGPLQKDADPGYPCIAVVFGVTSYGKACGFPGSSGMYTKVTYYIPWIESVVGKLP